jgi:hypothetical protein
MPLDQIRARRVRYSIRVTYSATDASGKAAKGVKPVPLQAPRWANLSHSGELDRTGVCEHFFRLGETALMIAHWSRLVQTALSLLAVMILTGASTLVAEESYNDTESVSSSDSANSSISEQPLGRDGRPLTPALTALGAKVRKTLAVYEPKHLNARDNTCWEVMHGLIAFGPRTEIFRDGPGGTTVNAMGRCQGEPLVILENDHPHALYGVGLQGHDGQFLAMLAQWKVRPESPMHIGGKDFTVADFIDEEKLTCQSGTELTFKLIALQHYLPSDAKWSSRNGEQWDIPKLLKAEIESPIHGATCGGSHRLFGIANAVNERVKRGEPINGQWARAAKYTADYQRYTLGTLQNPDGSFSTEWFNYPADRTGDVDRKIQTTGHMLEWLVWSLPEDELRDPRVLKAVEFVSSSLMANPNRAWSIGPLGHALHSLVIFHQRLYKDPTFTPNSAIAAEPLRTKVRTTGTDLMPPEPECEARIEMTIEQLQRAAAKAAAVHADHTAASDKAATVSDGCEDSIPPPSIADAALKTAMKPSSAPAVPKSDDSTKDAGDETVKR